MPMSVSSRTGLLLVASLTVASFSGCGWVDFGGDRGIGHPCDLQTSAGQNQGAYRSNAEECPTQLCLKPVVQQGASSAADTGPTCSGECGSDDDCHGELGNPADPTDTRCATGFTCGMPFVKGPLCCKKLCVCKDFVGPSGLPIPIACQGEGAMTCADTPGELPPGTSPVTNALGVEQTTAAYISLAPVRQLDLVVMVDNSSSMAPKIEKLNAGFPTLVEALKSPSDGTLPDLRIAIIDSDLGTGGAYADGPCGPKSLPDGFSSPYGDLGTFQMLSAPTACPITPGSLFLEHRSGLDANDTGSLSATFACLTSNLGTNGCFEEQPLQAFEFALAARGVGNEEQQNAFLRPSAQLGLILLSDEDDCSATPYGTSMFGDKPELRGETPSLRCATRGHMCGGVNLVASPPGYPTDSSYVHAFSDCRARLDACPFDWTIDASVPTACSPLRDIRELADEILALKSSQDQVLVAGIFGWPSSEVEMASAMYEIAPIPNPDITDTAHPTVFDYWPVCYDPNHLPSPATTDPVTGFDATAAAWGATGGLRESAFIDQFGADGLKFSICQPDFSPTMESIGRALANKMETLCIDGRLLDVDPLSPGVQADCRAVWWLPVVDPMNPSRVVHQESPTSMPQCAPEAANGAVPTDCWQLTYDPIQCPASGQRISVLRTPDEVRDKPQLDPGTTLKMECRSCPFLPAGVAAQPGCES